MTYQKALEAVKALPLAQQVALLRDVADGKDWSDVTAAWCDDLDMILSRIQQNASDLLAEDFARMEPVAMTDRYFHDAGSARAMLGRGL